MQGGAGRCREEQGGAGRCREVQGVQGSAGRRRKVQGGAGRSREVQGSEVKVWYWKSLNLKVLTPMSSFGADTKTIVPKT